MCVSTVFSVTQSCLAIPAFVLPSATTPRGPRARGVNASRSLSSCGGASSGVTTSGSVRSLVAPPPTDAVVDDAELGRAVLPVRHSGRWQFVVTSSEALTVDGLGERQRRPACSLPREVGARDLRRLGSSTTTGAGPETLRTFFHACRTTRSRGIDIGQDGYVDIRRVGTRRGDSFLTTRTSTTTRGVRMRDEVREGGARRAAKITRRRIANN